MHITNVYLIKKSHIIYLTNNINLCYIICTESNLLCLVYNWCMIINLVLSTFPIRKKSFITLFFRLAKIILLL